jgi:hypothetical protein
MNENEAAQQSDIPLDAPTEWNAKGNPIHTSPKLSLRMRLLFLFGDPLIALGLLAASILEAITGAITGRWEWTLCGIALAISAVGLLVLVLLMSLETLNG